MAWRTAVAASSNDAAAINRVIRLESMSARGTDCGHDTPDVEAAGASPLFRFHVGDVHVRPAEALDELALVERARRAVEESAQPAVDRRQRIAQGLGDRVLR